MNDRPNPPQDDDYQQFSAEEIERRHQQREEQRLQREEQRLKAAQHTAIAHKFEQGIYFLVGALELLLLLRFILRLSG
ncbi:MAG: YggT family protein, partial [Leptolyngbyaceae cyanobacterium SM1_1_3]|nr:YggT family protein [Leptolyngbyaceae cyanobacterium SM1_1_3]